MTTTDNYDAVGTHLSNIVAIAGNSTTETDFAGDGHTIASVNVTYVHKTVSTVGDTTTTDTYGSTGKLATQEVAITDSTDTTTSYDADGVTVTSIKTLNPDTSYSLAEIATGVTTTDFFGINQIRQSETVKTPGVGTTTTTYGDDGQTIASVTAINTENATISNMTVAGALTTTDTYGPTGTHLTHIEATAGVATTTTTYASDGLTAAHVQTINVAGFITFDQQTADSTTTTLTNSSTGVLEQKVAAFEGGDTVTSQYTSGVFASSSTVNIANYTTQTVAVAGATTTTQNFSATGMPTNEIVATTGADTSTTTYGSDGTTIISQQTVNSSDITTYLSTLSGSTTTTDTYSATGSHLTHVVAIALGTTTTTTYGSDGVTVDTVKSVNQDTSYSLDTFPAGISTTDYFNIAGVRTREVVATPGASGTAVTTDYGADGVTLTDSNTVNVAGITTASMTVSGSTTTSDQASETGVPQTHTVAIAGGDTTVTTYGADGVSVDNIRTTHPDFSYSVQSFVSGTTTTDAYSFSNRHLTNVVAIAAGPTTTTTYASDGLTVASVKVLNQDTSYTLETIAAGASTTDSYDIGQVRTEEVVSTTGAAASTTTTHYGSNGTTAVDSVTVNGAGVTTASMSQTGNTTTTDAYSATGEHQTHTVAVMDADTTITTYSTDGTAIENVKTISLDLSYTIQSTAAGTTTTDYYNTAGSHTQNIAVSSTQTATTTYAADGITVLSVLVNDPSGHPLSSSTTTGATTTTLYFNYLQEVYYETIATIGGNTEYIRYGLPGGYITNDTVVNSAGYTTKLYALTSGPLSESVLEISGPTGILESVTYDIPGGNTSVYGFGPYGGAYLSNATSLQVTNAAGYVIESMTATEDPTMGGVITTDTYSSTGVHQTHTVGTLAGNSVESFYDLNGIHVISQTTTNQNQVVLQTITYSANTTTTENYSVVGNALTNTHVSEIIAIAGGNTTTTTFASDGVTVASVLVVNAAGVTLENMSTSGSTTTTTTFNPATGLTNTTVSSNGAPLSQSQQSTSGLVETDTYNSNGTVTTTFTDAMGNSATVTQNAAGDALAGSFHAASSDVANNGLLATNTEVDASGNTLARAWFTGGEYSQIVTGPAGVRLSTTTLWSTGASLVNTASSIAGYSHISYNDGSGNTVNLTSNAVGQITSCTTVTGSSDVANNGVLATRTAVDPSTGTTYTFVWNSSGAFTLTTALLHGSTTTQTHNSDGSGITSFNNNAGISWTSSTTAAGNETASILTGNTSLTSGSGNDTLSADAAGSTLIATVGNDDLIGGAGADTFVAGSGSDILGYGSTGGVSVTDSGGQNGTYHANTTNVGNTYIAGTGTATFNGTVWNDTYEWNVGDGNITIVEPSVSNQPLAPNRTLLMGAGITASMITVSRNGTNLVLSIANGTPTPTTITVNGWYTNSTSSRVASENQISQLQFADGTTLSALQLTNAGLIETAGSGNVTLSGAQGYVNTLTTGAGNDTLVAGNLGDTLTATTGTDVLIGGAGHDTLIAGSGTDLLGGSGWAGNPNAGTNDTGVVGGVYTPNGTNLGNTYIAGSGADTFEGTAWSDLYEWRLGDGNLTISEPGTAAQPTPPSSTLQLSGVATSAVTVSRSGINLVLTIANGTATPNTIIISNWYVNSTVAATAAEDRVAQVQFPDGTTWTAAQLTAWGLVANAGNGSYVVLPGLTDYVNTLVAGTGSDTFTAGTLGDTLISGPGHDQFSGGAGIDTFLFNAAFSATDTIATGDSNNQDILEFGTYFAGTTVSLTRSSSNLNVIDGTGVINVGAWFSGSNQFVLELPNGTKFTAAQLSAAFGSNNSKVNFTTTGATTLMQIYSSTGVLIESVSMSGATTITDLFSATGVHLTNTVAVAGGNTTTTAYASNGTTISTIQIVNSVNVVISNTTISGGISTTDTYTNTGVHATDSVLSGGITTLTTYATDGSTVLSTQLINAAGVTTQAVHFQGSTTTTDFYTATGVHLSDVIAISGGNTTTTTYATDGATVATFKVVNSSGNTTQTSSTSGNTTTTDNYSATGIHQSNIVTIAGGSTTTTTYANDGVSVNALQIVGSTGVILENLTVSGSTTTTDLYNSAGTHLSEIVAIAGGNTVTTTYAADGVTVASVQSVNTFGVTTYASSTSGNTTTSDTYSASAVHMSHIVAVAGGATTTTAYASDGLTVASVHVVNANMSSSLETINGSTSTTDFFNSAGVRTGEIVAIAGGNTSISTYAADGVTISALQITNAAAVVIETLTNSAGTTTTDLYNASGLHLSEVVSISGGNTTTTNYGANGTSISSVAIVNAQGITTLASQSTGNTTTTDTFDINGVHLAHISAVNGGSTTTTNYASDGATVASVRIQNADGSYSLGTFSGGTETTDYFTTAGVRSSEVVAVTGGPTTTTTYGSDGQTINSLQIVNSAGITTERQQVTGSTTVTDTYGPTGIHLQTTTATLGANTYTATYTSDGLFVAASSTVNAAGITTQTISNVGNTSTTDNYDGSTGKHLSDTTAVAAGNTTTTVYASDGVTISTVSVVDSTGLLIQQDTTVGTTTTTDTYNSYGRVTEAVAIAGGTTTTTYYGRGGVTVSEIAVLYPDTGHTLAVYTGNEIITETYNSTGELVSDRVQIAGGTDTTTVDGVINGGYGPVSVLIVNPDNSHSLEQLSDGATSTAYYNAAGVLTSTVTTSTDGNGVLTTDTFDASNALTQAIVAIPSSTTSTTNYVANSVANVKVVNPNGSYTFETFSGDMSTLDTFGTNQVRSSEIVAVTGGITTTTEYADDGLTANSIQTVNQDGSSTLETISGTTTTLDSYRADQSLSSESIATLGGATVATDYDSNESITSIKTVNADSSYTLKSIVGGVVTTDAYGVNQIRSSESVVSNNTITVSTYAPDGVTVTSVKTTAPDASYTYKTISGLTTTIDAFNTNNILTSESVAITGGQTTLTVYGPDGITPTSITTTNADTSYTVKTIAGNTTTLDSFGVNQIRSSEIVTITGSTITTTYYNSDGLTPSTIKILNPDLSYTLQTIAGSTSTLDGYGTNQLQSFDQVTSGGVVTYTTYAPDGQTVVSIRTTNADSSYTFETFNGSTTTTSTYGSNTKLVSTLVDIAGSTKTTTTYASDGITETGVKIVNANNSYTIQAFAGSTTTTDAYSANNVHVSNTVAITGGTTTLIAYATNGTSILNTTVTNPDGTYNVTTVSGSTTTTNYYTQGKVETSSVVAISGSTTTTTVYNSNGSTGTKTIFNHDGSSTVETFTPNLTSTVSYNTAHSVTGTVTVLTGSNGVILTSNYNAAGMLTSSSSIGTDGLILQANYTTTAPFTTTKIFGDYNGNYINWVVDANGNLLSSQSVVNPNDVAVNGILATYSGADVNGVVTNRTWYSSGTFSQTTLNADGSKTVLTSAPSNSSAARSLLTTNSANILISDSYAYSDGSRLADSYNPTTGAKTQSISTSSGNPSTTITTQYNANGTTASLTTLTGDGSTTIITNNADGSVSTAFNSGTGHTATIVVDSSGHLISGTANTSASTISIGEIDASNNSSLRVWNANGSYSQTNRSSANNSPVTVFNVTATGISQTITVGSYETYSKSIAANGDTDVFTYGSTGLPATETFTPGTSSTSIAYVKNYNSSGYVTSAYYTYANGTTVRDTYLGQAQTGDILTQSVTLNSNGSGSTVNYSTAGVITSETDDFDSTHQLTQTYTAASGSPASETILVSGLTGTSDTVSSTFYGSKTAGSGSSTITTANGSTDITMTHYAPFVANAYIGSGTGTTPYNAQGVEAVSLGSGYGDILIAPSVSSENATGATLEGLAGKTDVLVGGGGIDIYGFNLGDGNDLIASTGDMDSQDEIKIGTALAGATLTASLLGNSLELSDGRGDAMLVSGWGLGYNPIAIQTSTGTLSNATILADINATPSKSFSLLG